MNAALFALALAASAPAGPLDGTWFFDDFRRSGRTADSELMIVWNSSVSVTGDSFTINRFLGTPLKYTGKVRVSATDPTQVDLELAAFDLTPFGMPITIPAGIRAGRIKQQGEMVRLAFHRNPGGARPTAADQKSDEVMRATLKRGPAKGTAMPKQIEVTVTTPDGKPAVGVQLTSYISFTPPTQKKTIPGPDGKPQTVFMVLPDTGKLTPQLQKLATTDAEGKAKVPYATFSAGTLIAYDEATKAVCYQPVTPAGLVSGAVAVTLVPCREVTMKVSCPDLPDGGSDGKPPKLTGALPAGAKLLEELPPEVQKELRAKLATEQMKPQVMPLMHVSSYIHAHGRRIAFSSSSANTLRFLAPPGDYRVNVYGGQILGRDVSITVPPGEGVYNAAPVKVAANAGTLLIGQPAPELAGVHTSIGGSVKLANYKGKYVVLDFWGYWCYPCLQAMPAWIAVQDHFKGEGVVVVTVHDDGDGSVTNKEQYDAKINSIKKQLWKGRDLPFPVALVSGKDGEHGQAAKQYGVQSWPTTYLIGPDGIVISTFGHRDGASAIEALKIPVENLLKKK